MNDYIGRLTAAKQLGVDHRSVERIAIAGNVRRKVLPGRSPRYHRDDIARIAAGCFFVGATPAGELAKA